MDLDKGWQEVQESVDVYQLWEILVFTYGADKLSDSKEDIELEEGDYNPDHLYETIRYEMEEKGIFEDFVTKFEEYQITMQENDPMHWRYRKKQQEKFNNWDL